MLYVALVIALPVNSNKRENDHDTFPADEILAYDIEILPDNGNQSGIRLSELGLLAGESSVAYDQVGIPLPSFLLSGNDHTPWNHTAWFLSKATWRS